MLSLQKKLFLVVALCLGLVSLARAVPVLAETIQVEGGLAISGEFTGASVETETPPKADSDERIFVTLPVPTGDQSPTTSSETTFQTLPGEGTFTTTSQPETPPPGNSSGGSSSGSRRLIPSPPLVPTSPTGQCPIYLTKFIHLGRENDPVEVLKLQRFLRDYEGLVKVPLSGVYDLATYQAVMVFQTRYADAILKPWGIDYPTGYVYITTTLAINNLYCERDPATTLDLRARFTPSGIEEISATTSTSTLPLPAGELEMGEATSTNRFLVAALGLFDFFKRIPYWWWFIFLLLIGLTIITRRDRNRDG